MTMMSDRYQQLMQRIVAGEKVMIDGGTGSDVERRGVERVTHGWTGGAALSHPEVVQQVHADYIKTGANLIITNTFATHMGVLRDTGAEADFEALNRRAVELAVAARDASGKSSVLVGAGISHWTFTGDDPTLDELERNATEQASIMAAAGADVFILEMVIDIERMHCLLRAAHSTGLPVWVGFTVGTEDGELPDPTIMTLRGGELLADAVQALEGQDVDLVAIMHTDIALVDQCLEVTFSHWSAPVAVYAHDTKRADGAYVFDDVISPEDYAAHAARWLDRGVHVIGGCCGTRPDHMTEIANLTSVT